MKKVLFLALTISVIGSANAQSNSILVYGDGGYSSSGQYSVSTGIGYQFNKNWTAGGTFGVSRLSPSGAPSLFTTHSVGGFLRYTENFGHENRFFWYAHINAGYFSGLNEERGPGGFSRYSWDGVSASLAPGIGINLPRGFALTFTPASISFRMENRGFGGNQHRAAIFDAGIGRGAFGATPVFGITKNFNLGHKKPKLQPAADIAP